MSDSESDKDLELTEEVVQNARRFDYGQLRSKPRRTQQNFLRIGANMTRTGVLKYKRPDGSVVRELRHPDDVFEAKSISSIENAPFTEFHPPEMVTSSNALSFTKGNVITARQDGKFIAGEIIVQEEKLIKKIEAGELSELSPGYTCDVVKESGTYKGEVYDQRQRNIRYNHVAIGGKNWGRSGSEVKVRLDSQDAVEYRKDDYVFEESKDEPKEKTNMEKIRIDGIDYEVPETSLQAVNSELEKSATAAKESKVEADKQAARADALEAERDALKAELDTALNTDVVLEKAKARLALEASVKEFGVEKTDGLTDGELLRAALTANDIDVADKSDDYVSARFDAMVEYKVRKDSEEEEKAEEKAEEKCEAEKCEAEKCEKSEEADKSIEETRQATKTDSKNTVESYLPAGERLKDCYKKS